MLLFNILVKLTPISTFKAGLGIWILAFLSCWNIFWGNGTSSFYSLIAKKINWRSGSILVSQGKTAFPLPKNTEEKTQSKTPNYSIMVKINFIGRNKLKSFIRITVYQQALWYYWEQMNLHKLQGIRDYGEPPNLFRSSMLHVLSALELQA